MHHERKGMKSTGNMFPAFTLFFSFLTLIYFDCHGQMSERKSTYVPKREHILETGKPKISGLLYIPCQLIALIDFHIASKNIYRGRFQNYPKSRSARAQNVSLSKSELDLNIHTSRKIQLHQSVNGSRR